MICVILCVTLFLVYWYARPKWVLTVVCISFTLSCAWGDWWTFSVVCIIWVVWGVLLYYIKIGDPMGVLDRIIYYNVIEWGIVLSYFFVLLWCMPTS